MLSCWPSLARSSLPVAMMDSFMESAGLPPAVYQVKGCTSIGSTSGVRRPGRVWKQVRRRMSGEEERTGRRNLAHDSRVGPIFPLLSLREFYPIGRVEVKSPHH